MKSINLCLKSQKGQTMAEYALVVVLVVGVLVVVLGNNGSFKSALEGAFSKVSSAINNAGT